MHRIALGIALVVAGTAGAQPFENEDAALATIFCGEHDDVFKRKACTSEWAPKFKDAGRFKTALLFNAMGHCAAVAPFTGADVYKCIDSEYAQMIDAIRHVVEGELSKD